MVNNTTIPVNQTNVKNVIIYFFFYIYKYVLKLKSLFLFRDLYIIGVKSPKRGLLLNLMY